MEKIVYSVRPTPSHKTTRSSSAGAWRRAWFEELARRSMYILILQYDLLIYTSFKAQSAVSL